MEKQVRRCKTQTSREEIILKLLKKMYCLVEIRKVNTCDDNEHPSKHLFNWLVTNKCSFELLTSDIMNIIHTFDTIHPANTYSRNHNAGSANKDAGINNINITAIIASSLDDPMSLKG